MTDRDVLKRASEALRETTEPTPEDLLKLRQRVLGGGQVVPLSQARRKRALRWVLPLAAAFVAASALAATPGAWEGMLHSVERFLDIELLAPSHEAKPNEKAGKRRRPPAPPSVPSVAPQEAVAAEPVAEPAAAEPAPAAEPRAVEAVVPVVPARTRTRSSSTSIGTSRPSGEVSSVEAAEAEPSVPKGPTQDLALYKTAHELHFGAKRYDEALNAWEKYLALPSPTFALEARYNRALCLLRLGHYEEARAALRPFAEGRVLGSYRRAEAQRLLEALDKRR
ncbi:MAG TPA: hypothetical protein VFZ61_08025 [Polyangiales bacterium]